MTFTPAQVLDHALTLITTERDQALRFAARYQRGEALLTTAIGIINTCSDNIHSYEKAFYSLLEAFGHPDPAAELRQQARHHREALSETVQQLLAITARACFDGFGQPTNGPVIGEEFRARESLRAQSTSPDLSGCAQPTAAQVRSAQADSPGPAPQRSDLRHPDRRSGTA